MNSKKKILTMRINSSQQCYTFIENSSRIIDEIYETINCILKEFPKLNRIENLEFKIRYENFLLSSTSLPDYYHYYYHLKHVLNLYEN